jgi:lysophospholipase L1-like esterase
VKVALALTVAVLTGASIWTTHPKAADDPLFDPDLPLISLQGPLTLALIGTSLTADTTWPEDTTAHLQKCYPDTITLRRLAKGGETSTWGLANISKLLDAPPDIALIEFTINDADIRRRVSMNDSADNHRALIEALRGANPDVQIVLLRLNRAYGLRAMLRPRLAAYETSLADIAKTEHVSLIDLRPLWASAGRGTLYDGIHPEASAIAQITTPALSKELGRRLGQDCD